MPTLGLAWYESLTCERAIAAPDVVSDTAKPSWPSRPAALSRADRPPAGMRGFEDGAPSFMQLGRKD